MAPPRSAGHNHATGELPIWLDIVPERPGISALLESLPPVLRNQPSGRGSLDTAVTGGSDPLKFFGNGRIALAGELIVGLPIVRPNLDGLSFGVTAQIDRQRLRRRGALLSV
jgi:hypothetical protein